MRKRERKDLETISLFLTLGLLTLILVFILRVVLFGPSTGGPFVDLGGIFP